MAHYLTVPMRLSAYYSRKSYWPGLFIASYCVVYFIYMNKAIYECAALYIKSCGWDGIMLVEMRQVNFGHFKGRLLVL